MVAHKRFNHPKTWVMAVTQVYVGAMAQNWGAMAPLTPRLPGLWCHGPAGAMPYKWHIHCHPTTAVLMTMRKRYRYCI